MGFARAIHFAIQMYKKITDLSEELDEQKRNRLELQKELDDQKRSHLELKRDFEKFISIITKRGTEELFKVQKTELAG